MLRWESTFWWSHQHFTLPKTATVQPFPPQHQWSRLNSQVTAACHRFFRFDWIKAAIFGPATAVFQEHSMAATDGQREANPAWETSTESNVEIAERHFMGAPPWASWKVKQHKVHGNLADHRSTPWLGWARPPDPSGLHRAVPSLV